METAKRSAPEIGIWRSHGQRNVADAQKLRTSTRGQSDDEARQNLFLLVSQRPEDGGPTIQLPAAEIPLHPSSPEFESSICDRRRHNAQIDVMDQSSACSGDSAVSLTISGQ